MAQVQARKGRTKPAHKVVWEFPLERTNWMILAVGAGAILLGYGLMWFTAVTDDPIKHSQIWNNPFAISIAPILLVAGFVGIIPYGLLWRAKAPVSNQLMSD